MNFASPTYLGKLLTSDPLHESVRKWWKEKVKEIYEYIPDFGGFLVKADSEYTSGPFAYGRTHAQGANAKEWCDEINTYFFRKSGIKDEFDREIH